MMIFQVAEFFRQHQLEEEAFQFRKSLSKKAIRLETRIYPASSQKTL